MIAKKPMAAKAAPSFEHERMKTQKTGKKAHQGAFKKAFKQMKEKLDAPTIKKRKGSPPIR